MRYAVCDIESDGLLDTITRVHSLVLRDLESEQVVSCCNQPGYLTIAHGLELLKTMERVYFHNGIRFDYHALRKVYPQWDMDRSKIRDTLVIAQMRWAHIKDSDMLAWKQGKLPGQYIGKHSLKAWGYRLGVLKTDFDVPEAEEGLVGEKWDKWTPQMQHYCEQDTAVGKALVEHIRLFPPSDEAMDIEHRLAWYLAQQESNGWPFDVGGAITLQAQLTARREVLREQLSTAFQPWTVSVGMVTPKRTMKRKGVQYTAGVPYMKTKTITFNPGSRDHIADRLINLFKWEPTTFTGSGKPEMNDDVLEGVDSSIPEVKLLLEFLLVDKRLGQIAEGKQAWLTKFTSEGEQGGKLTGLPHIHGGVKQNGTITHRAAHVNPNLGQVPKVGSPYGAECRALFHVPDGWVQVGADLAGLEARCLAHYMARFDDGAYGRLLLEGDVHTANRIALELPEGKLYRDGTKNWYYAFMYGAGDEKLGKMLAPLMGMNGLSSEKLKALGKSKRAKFLKNVPALGALIADVKCKAKSKGYLLTLDGRRVYVRSDHSALNTLLQTAGAIIAKKWIVNYSDDLESNLGPQGWRGEWVGLGWIHDEVQVAVRALGPEYPGLAGLNASHVGECLVNHARALTEHFKFRIPIDAAYKMGANWKETH